MKTIFNYLLLLLLLPVLSNGQNLVLKKTEIEVSKDARKKGMYVSSTRDEQGNILSFVAYDLKKNQLGFDVITVDNKGAVVGVKSEVVVDGKTTGYNVEIPKPGTVANPAQGKTVLRLVTANGMLGKMKIEEEKFEPRYRKNEDNIGNTIVYTKVLRGFKFEPGKSYDSDTKLNIFAAHSSTANNLQASYNIIEGLIPNTVAYLPAQGEIAFLGKSPQVGKSSPNAHNVITTGKFEGKTKTFTNLKEHVLEYNLGMVTTGFSADGNRAVLTSTVNAPSSIAAHKKWQAGDEPYMSFLSFTANGDLVDNVTFKASAIRGNFCIVPGKNANYVVGSVDGDHKGYFRADVGKPSQLEIIKIENGKVAAQRTFDMETITKSLLKTPGGKKGKLSYKVLYFEYSQVLSNGDILVFAATDESNIIFQFDADGQLKATYMPGRVDGKDFSRSGLQVIENNNEVYVMYREQAPGMAIGFVKSFKGAGVTKKVEFDRVDELMTYGRIVKINTSALTCSMPVDITEEVILGETPLFLGASGELLLLLRDSKDNYSLGRIE